MSNIVVYFAPVPGSHKVGMPDRIVVRRPAEYARGSGSATAIKVHAYASNGPREDVWSAAYGWQNSECTKPIFEKLIWVSADHRARWDERTGHRCGSTGEPTEFMRADAKAFAAEFTDVEKVERAIWDARAALREWHEKNP